MSRRDLDWLETSCREGGARAQRSTAGHVLLGKEGAKGGQPRGTASSLARLSQQLGGTESQGWGQLSNEPRWASSL